MNKIKTATPPFEYTTSEEAAPEKLARANKIGIGKVVKRAQSKKKAVKRRIISATISSSGVVHSVPVHKAPIYKSSDILKNRRASQAIPKKKKSGLSKTAKKA